MPTKLIYENALNSCYTSNQLEIGRKQIIEQKNGLVKIGHDCKDNVCAFTTDIISEACCLRTGKENGKNYTFDIDSQKCYWKSGHTTNDCVKKLNFNSNKDDSSLFEIGLGENCGLNISFDYLVKFDCSVFNSTCQRDTDEKLTLESQLSGLQSDYNKLLSIAKLNNVFILRSFNDFENLCYVIEGSLGLPNAMLKLVGSSEVPQNGPLTPFGLPTNDNDSDAPLGDVVASPSFLISSSSNIASPSNTDFVSNENLFLGWPWFGKKTKVIKNLSHPISAMLRDSLPDYGDIYPMNIDYSKLDFNYYSPKNTPPLFGGGLGEIKYCLTDLGLELFNTIIGENKYNLFVSSYGCEKSYTQEDFNDFINKINDLVKTQNKLVSDYVIQTTQNICDKSNKYNEYVYFESKKNEYVSQLATLSNQITQLTETLNNLINYGDSSLESLKNIESLKLTFVLEYKEKDEYKPIYENEFFNIGENNMSQYIIEKDGDTGILIDDATTELCSIYKEQFINTLYTERYIIDNSVPETETEKNDVNKLLNGWYNSVFIGYNIDIPEDIVKQIDGKKIRYSILIDTCCLDLCLLTDNIRLDKKCSSLDNQDIIISKPPHFELERVLDNKKSWVNIDEPTNREFDLLFRETNYVANDPKLILNTKEIELKIDGANAIEEDVLNNISCLISNIIEPTTQTSFTNLFTFTADTDNNITDLLSNDSLLQSFYDLGLLDDKLNGIPLLNTGSTLNFGNIIYNQTEIPFSGLSINDWVLTNTGTTIITTITNSFLSNESNITIPISGSATPYPVTFTVSGVTNDISNIYLKLSGFTHSYLRDLGVSLVSPSGSYYTPILTTQGTNGNINNLTVTFSSDATSFWDGSTNNGTFINDSSINSTMVFDSPAPTFSASSSYQDLTIFIGLTSSETNGTWKLYIKDFSDSDSGTTINATLGISYGQTVITGQTSGITDYYYVGCENIDLDEKLTTDLSLINNVDEFRKALTSELVDVKTRKILSKYPVLYLLYDRYIGNCSDCSTNKLTYNNVKSFIDSIGKYWVNLAEQFVPSTSIWAATDVIRNPIFSTQKYKYRKGIISFGKKGLRNTKKNSNDSIKLIDTTTECVIYKVDFKPMPTSLAASATTLNYQFDVDFETSLVSNPSNPIEYNIIIGDTQQTYGNIDIETLENKLNVINENIMNNPFSSGTTHEYGLCSSVGFYNPMFIGKVTITDNANPNPILYA